MTLEHNRNGCKAFVTNWKFALVMIELDLIAGIREISENNAKKLDRSSITL